MGEGKRQCLPQTPEAIKQKSPELVWATSPQVVNVVSQTPPKHGRLLALLLVSLQTSMTRLLMQTLHTWVLRRRNQAGPDLETSLPLTIFHSNERFSASNQGRKVIHRQFCNRTLQATIKTDLALYAHWCIHGGNVTGISDSFLIGFNVYLTR